MTPAAKPSSPRTRRAALLAAPLLALTLAGCQTASTQGPAYTGSIGGNAGVTPSDLSPEQALGAVQKWGTAYGRNEKDKTVALNYAAALRASGETKQAVAVMRKAVIYHPTDRAVLGSFGKALAADGQFNEALATVRRAQRSDNPDWQLLSTEGGILDSIGNQTEARARYRQALVLAPGEPQVLSNLAMSYVLTGELDEAESVLRQALANPRATLKTRQNLDLVLRLKAEGATAALPSKTSQDTAAAEIDAAPAEAAEENTWEELART